MSLSENLGYQKTNAIRIIFPYGDVGVPPFVFFLAQKAPQKTPRDHEGCAEACREGGLD